MKGLAELTAENDALVAAAEAPRKAALKRLRRRMQDVTLTIGIEEHQRRYVLREIDEWIERETKRGVL